MSLHSLTPDCVAGYVLSGGRSRRMGTDKAALSFGGTPLLEHVAGQVRAAAGTATVVGGAGIPDLYPGFGPVGGIVTALRSGGAEWNLIVACDMPLVTAEWLRTLVEAAEESDAQVVLSATTDGRIHPLCAVYHRSALPALQQAVDSGIHTLREAIKPLRTLDVPVPEARLVTNVNTLAEWAAIAGGQE